MAWQSYASGESKYFSHWPAGSSPDEIGKRLAENFLNRQFEYQQGKREFLIYPEACAWYGALNISRELRDDRLEAALVDKFQPFTGPEAKNISPQAHVDYRVIGIVPLEIYLLNHRKDLLDLGLGFADRQWATTTPDGITTEARYWIDDMYMITALQMQAYRASGDKKYLDRAAKTMGAYLDKLQQPNGLFFHAPDSPFYWGRGNGWEAAGMTEILLSMPKDHPLRARILRGYKQMMASLLTMQAKDGLWPQLLDHPEAWEETSGSGMFAFAFITGVKKGWLSGKTYGPAARKAWIGLASHIDPSANVTDVCEGTNKGPSVQYYLDRQRKTGDLHGQAAVMWSAMALIRK